MPGSAHYAGNHERRSVLNDINITAIDFQVGLHRFDRARHHSFVVGAINSTDRSCGERHFVGSSPASTDGPASADASNDSPSAQPAVLKPVTVASKVLRSSDGATQVVVPVDVAGRTYVFIVDTGAAATVIDSAVVKAANLPSVGKPLTENGVGCSAPAQPVRITDWSIGGEKLPTETAPSTKTEFSGRSIDGLPLGGLLGADVDKAFGLLTVDYKNARITLGGVPPTGRQKMPVTVESKNGETIVLAAATLHGVASPMLVDTGASTSLVSAKLATAAGLAKKGKSKEIGGVSCRSTEQPVLIDQLKVGNVSFPAVTGASTSSGPLGFGLLGSDLLRTFGTATIDFNGQQVILG